MKIELEKLPLENWLKATKIKEMMGNYIVDCRFKIKVFSFNTFMRLIKTSTLAIGIN